MPDFRNSFGTQVSYQKTGVYTNDATPFALFSIPLQAGEGGRVIIDVVAMDDLGNRSMYYWFAPVKRALNGVVTIGTINKLQTVEDTALTACDITITAATDSVVISVVGIAGKNIVWSGIPDINTIAY